MHWETKETLINELSEARRLAVLSNAVTCGLVAHYVWGFGWPVSALCFAGFAAAYSAWARV